MDKALREHEAYMITTLRELSDAARAASSETDQAQLRSKLQDVRAYHAQMVHHFQHERLVHLLVTFFFAGLLLLAIVGLFVAGAYQYLASIQLPLLLVALLLCVTEIFYVRHYFLLENGTQRLYALTQKLYMLNMTTREKTTNEDP